MTVSHEAGDLWLQRHAHIIAGVDVFRWSEAIGHEHYLFERWKIGRLYRENPEIRNRIERAIKEVAIRRQIDTDNLDMFMRLSIQYLLEEAAGKAVENELYPGVSAYPGSTPDIWSIFASLPEFAVP